MGVLGSARFTQGDAVTVRKLEDCATGSPTEASSHFTVGRSSGPAVTKLQEALKDVQRAHPELGIPAFEINGQYDQAFANAILTYKTKREIRNFANKFDNIVGIKTIRSLDTELAPKVNPQPNQQPKKPGEVPRRDRPIIPGNCVTDENCPEARNFVIQLIAGGTGGEIVEAAFLSFIIQDQVNRLSALYSLTGAGLATPGPPVTPSGGGAPRPFRTSLPTRLTRFGPVGGITSVTIGPPGGIPGVPNPLKKTIVSTLSFSFRTSGSVVPSGFVVLNNFDTGPLSFEGAGIHGGRLKLENRCEGGPGADRTI